FSVPLRRSLIIDQDLAFPEGKAAAEVLKAGEDPSRGIRVLAIGAILGAVAKLAAAGGLRLIPDNGALTGRLGKGLVYVGSNLSPALLGVGYIVGLNVGFVIVLGSLISWNIVIPIYSSYFLDSNPELAGAVASLSATDAAYTIWSHQIRYLGVG